MRLSIPLLIVLAGFPVHAAGQTVPPVVAGPPASPTADRQTLLRQAREARKDIVQPPRQTTLEKWISRAEPLLMPPPASSTVDRRGFYVKFGGVAPGSGWSFGPGYRYEGLAGGRLDASAFARASWKRYWEVAGRLEMPHLNGGATKAGVAGKLRDLPQEDFFGFGPESRESDRVNYALREVAAGAFVEHRMGRALVIEGGLDFVRPSTRAGADSNYPSIEERFDLESLPGFSGDPDFVVARAGARYDRTDTPGNPRRGAQYIVDVARWQARGGVPSSFNAATVDVRQYMPFFNETRVIAIRGAVWQTQPAGGSEVPLYYQPVLGGSHTLRGYSEFRFRDRSAVLLQAEYRYEILSGIDGAVFVETGTVGRSLGHLGRLASDYGLGLRIGTSAGVFLRIEAAFGTPESPRFFIKLSDAF
jgi:hypothetical protein